METNVLTQFSFHFKEVVIDEVALEGLEGITLDLLWKRVEKRFSTTLSEKNKARIWNFIINFRDIKVYKLPEPRAPFEIVDRFIIIDEESGHLDDPEEYPDGPYEFCPVRHEYGSCQHYATRELLDKLEISSLEQVVREYGHSLVLVASLQERWRALAPHAPITMLESLFPLHYCMLELIGKGRENGQMSVGKTNLVKLFKDQKLLFYNKKRLQAMGLVSSVTTIQQRANRGNKAILIRLKRFHKSRLASLPKIGKQSELAAYLKNKPNFSERVEVLIRDGMVTAKQMKKIRKSTSNIVKYEEVAVDDQNDTLKPPKVPRLHIRGVRKQLRLVVESDESSGSEDEAPPSTEVECKYKIGRSLMRQAYERFLEVGIKGLTQMQLCQELGIEFYTSRTICRAFKRRHIIREFLEDKGRQRTTRFIAVAATGVEAEKYAQEKQRLMDYLSKPNTETVPEVPDSAVPSTSTDTEEVPKKKCKVEKPDTSKVEEPDAIIEITNIEGLKDNLKKYSTLLKEAKGPTMRQLKFANGLIKITREKRSVAGFQTLSNLVSKEINEPSMDSKAVKSFVQKLVSDGQLKLYKLKWPGKNKYTNLICAANIEKNNPIVKAKYKEICMRAVINSRSKSKESVGDTQKQLVLYAYPRYMKVRKLHEFITKNVYFSGDSNLESDLPPGFTSLMQIIPEMTVELAIGHISPTAMPQIMHIKLTDQLLKQQLKDIPANFYRILLQSKSFQVCLRANLKILASFGLLQLCYNSASTVEKQMGLLQYVFYVNRNAKYFDTSGYWPREVDDLATLERRVRFETHDDVLQYWTTIFQISTNTIITGRPKNRVFPEVPIRQHHEVQKLDDGSLFGDCRGAAGFDSAYCMDLHRNWELLNLVNFNPDEKIDRERTRKTKLKQIRSKTKAPSQPKKRKTKIRMRQRPKKVVSTNIIRRRRRKPTVMGKWEPWEDELLMLCKAGMTIMSPTSQPGCLSIRNQVAKDILSIYDTNKLASLCHKRMLTLESKSTFTHTKECLINEARRRNRTLAKYDGLLNRLRLEHSHSMAKYINTARIPLMELVMNLYNILRSDSFNKRTPCIAVNLEDFHRDYTITTATSSMPFNLYKSPADLDIEITTIKEAQIMALAMKIDRELDTDSSMRIFNILGQYPDELIRVAMEHLRKSGIVAAKEKFVNNLVTRLSFQDVVESGVSKATISTYRMSANYLRHMTCKFDTGFGDDLAKILDEHLPNPLPARPEVNCVLLERQAANLVEVVTLHEPTVVGSSGLLQDEQSNMNTLDTIEMTIDSSFRLKTGMIGWRSKAGATPPVEPQIKCEEFLQDAIIRPAIVIQSNNKYPKRDKVIELVEGRKEKGAKFKELQDLTGLDVAALNDRLNQLASAHVIARVGFFDNIVVLTKFATPWTISVDDKGLVPSPWVTLEWAVNKPVFVKWCSVVINTVLNCPGISIMNLSSELEMISARAVHDICLFLEKCRCVKLEVLKIGEPDLFSDKDDVTECDVVSEFDSPGCIFVSPVRDSFCQFVRVRKCLLAENSSGL